MKIDKKKVFTLFALTLLITSLLLVNMNGPTIAQPSTDPIHLDGPPLELIHMNSNKTLTPVHMHYVDGELPPIPPLATLWHQLHPEYCEYWVLTSWEDEGFPYEELSPNDQIDMTNMDTYEVRWYHVDRMTWTMRLYTEDFGFPEEIYVEYKGPYETIYDPNCTWWHEVWPLYSNVYHIINWADNGNQYLDFCDFIEFEQFPGILWHVEEMATDIILREKLVDPICTWWHAIYPEEEYCKWYHVTSWENMTSPYFYPGDQIDMTDKDGNVTWYFVDRITVTLNVSLETNKSKWMKIELKSDFEEIYEVFKYPWDTRWHEVYPDYCNVYDLTGWDLYSDDNCNGVLDVCDFIWLVNATGQEPETRWHIDDMTYDLILNRKIADPTCTTWHELDPDFCEIAHEYHITGWEDNTDELLSPCDNVTMELDPPSGLEDKYHVESMTLTLNLTVIDPMGGPVSQGQRIFIELLDVPYEYMYWPKIEPEYQYDWEIVCPGWLPGVFWIENWDDNCNGVLSHCDNITLVDPTGLPFVRCHVDEVAVDMVVEKVAEPVHDVAVIDVFSLYPWVYQGEIDPINVTVENQGNQIETVDVYAVYDGNLAAPKQTVVMNPGDVTTLTFNWNTAGVPPGNYTVSAIAMLIPPIIDGDPDDNAATGNVQEVREPPPFYWKEGYPEYAPSGLPDFDQKQDLWQNPMLPPGQNWTWCGPTAVGNSLWWMDSRYHPSNLLTAYVGAVSEHDPSNVPPFIDHLAYLMDTDGRRTGIMRIGTNVFDMEAGIAQYLSWTGVNPQGDVNGDGTVDNADLTIVNNAMGTMPGVVGWDMAADIFPVTTGWPALIMADNIIDPSDLNLVLANMGQNGTFYEHTIPAPDYYLIEEEVERCQDVVLLIAPYYGQDRWDEEAHFVTVSGVNSPLTKIAFSDPMWDAFENGLTPEGRVLPLGVPHNHPPSPPDTTHNNASLVSHDIYNVTFNPILGMWEVIGYPGYNWPTQPGYVWVIEYAVITSPLAEEVCGVEITNVTVSKSEAYRCCPDMNVNVTVHNNGTVPINCTVSAYYYNVTVHQINVSQNIVNLAPSTTATLTFSWDLTGVTENITYTIKANVTCTCGASHEFVNGKVKVRLWGDVNGDGNVLATDLAIVKSTVTKVMLGILTTQQALAEQPFADLNCDGQLTATDVAISKSEVTKAMM